MPGDSSTQAGRKKESVPSLGYRWKSRNLPKGEAFPLNLDAQEFTGENRSREGGGRMRAFQAEDMATQRPGRMTYSGTPGDKVSLKHGP